MRIDPSKYLVDISPEEFACLSDEEKKRMLEEGYVKKSMAVKFLVEQGYKRRTVYHNLKIFGKYIPLIVILSDDRELYGFLAFKEKNKNKDKKTVRRKIRRKETKRDFTNLKDLAQKFGISYRHVKRLRKQGKIIAVREGKHCRVISHLLG